MLCLRDWCRDITHDVCQFFDETGQFAAIAGTFCGAACHAGGCLCVIVRIAAGKAVNEQEVEVDELSLPDRHIRTKRATSSKSAARRISIQYGTGEGKRIACLLPDQKQASKSSSIL